MSSDPPTALELKPNIPLPKRGEVTDPEELPLILFEFGGEASIKALTSLFRNMEGNPLPWEELPAIYNLKNGLSSDCNNHHEISLIR